MKLSDLNEKDIQLVSSPETSETSEDPGLLDKIKQHVGAVADQYARAGQTATDFINAAGRGAVSSALPLTGINTEKLAGGVGAVGDVLTGDNPLPKDLSMDEIKEFGKRLGVSYEDAKKFAEKYKQEEEKRSPIASLGGELTGAVAGGGALMKGVGKAVPALADLGSGKLVGQTLGKVNPALAIPESGGGVGGAVARAGAKAVEGAPLGAIYGADTAQPGYRTSGALTGAAMGSTVGLGVGLGLEGAKGLKNLYDASKGIGQSNQKIRQFQLAREVAREGVETPNLNPNPELGNVEQNFNAGNADIERGKINTIYGAEGGDKITKAADDLSKEATEQLYGAREGLQDQYGKVLTDLDKQGVKLAPDSQDLVALQEAQDVSDKLPNLFGDKGQILQTKDLLNKFQQGTLMPSEAKQLQLNLRKAVTNSSSKGLGAEQSKIEGLLSSVTDGLNDLPKPQSGGQGYQDVNDLYREYSGTMGSLANKGEIDPNYVDKWVSDLGNRSDIKNVMSELIDYVQKPGVSGDDKRLVLNKVAENFNNLNTSKPGFLKSQGVDFNTIKQNINQMSDLVNISKYARGEQTLTSPLQSLVGRVGPLAATAVGKVEKAVPKFTQQLFNMPNETLRSITPDLPEHVSSALSNAINTGDQAKKNAVLFSIVQNPDLRKRVGKTLGLGGEE